MLKIFLLSACCACTSYGRRVHMKTEDSDSHIHEEARQMTAEQVHGSLLKDILGSQETDATASRKSSTKVLTDLFLSFNNLAAGKRNRAFDSAHTHVAAPALPVHQVRPQMVSGSDGKEANRKRFKAERLASEAEQALLETKRLEALADGLREERLERQLAKDGVPTPTPDTAAPAESHLRNAAGFAQSSPSPSSSATPVASDVFAIFKSASSTASNAEPEKKPTLASKRIKQMLTDESLDSVQLSEMQIQIAKRKVFDINMFYVTDVEQTSFGTIFRGDLGTNSSIAFESVTSKAAEVPELQDTKFLLLEDPLHRYSGGTGKRPDFVFLALPKRSTQLEQKFPEFILTLSSLLCNAITVASYALMSYGLTDGSAILKALETGDATPLFLIMPIAVGLFGIQVLHEAAHYGAAGWYGIKTGIPYFVPSIEMGSVGGCTRLLSLPPNRTSLFDFAASGPVVAGSFSFALYFIGLLLSTDLPTPDMTAAVAGFDAMPDIVRSAASMVTSSTASSAAAEIYSPGNSFVPVVPTGFLHKSWLLSALAGFIVPATHTETLVALHPLALIGFIGVFINALQLLPIGRLDGGRIATAILGQQRASFLSVSLTLGVALYNLFGTDPVIKAFGIFTFCCQRKAELPCTDDVSPIDWRRESLAITAAAVVLLTLWQSPATPLPFPPVLPFIDELHF